GALLGPLVATGMVALTGHWNATYLVWALAGALTLAGLRVVFAPPVPAPRQTAAATESPAAAGNPLALALRSRIVWLAAVFLCLYVGAEVSLGSWSYTLLTQGRRVPPLQASWMVSGFWFGLVVGRLALGRVAERKGVAWLVQACIAGVLISVTLVWVAPAGSVAALGLWLAGLSLGPIFPSTIALLDATVAPRLQQSAIGFAASLGAMGSAIFPWLAGNLIERAGLWALLPFVASLTVALLGLWLTLRPAVKGS
ncbi:MAG TPA: MFS transporter, partial [Ktedonobacterales bacterium]|nr:MFS transporter [Ktedonobacterales bacterium]